MSWSKANDFGLRSFLSHADKFTRKSRFHYPSGDEMSGAERKSSHQYTYAKVAEGDDAPNSGNGDILDAIFADSSEVSDIALNE